MPTGPSRTDPTTLLWESHLRLQASAIPETASARARSAELLDVLFLTMVDVLRPGLFVEAGAFEATTSIEVARIVPEATVVAFEANPGTHHSFSAKHAYAELGVDYRCAALTSEAGELRFHREDASDPMRAGSSSLLPRNRSGDVWAPDTVTDEVVVEGLRLDDAVDTSVDPSAAWIDVEGAAHAVLEGADAFLKTCHLVKMEMEDVEFWSGQWLATDVLEHFLSRGFVPIARDAEYPQQFNVVLARPDLARDGRVLQAQERYLRSALSSEPPSTGESTFRRVSERLRRVLPRTPG